jgi:hypothetical protein
LLAGAAGDGAIGETGDGEAGATGDGATGTTGVTGVTFPFGEAGKTTNPQLCSQSGCGNSEIPKKLNKS